MGGIFIYLKNLCLAFITHYGYWGILGLSLAVAIYQPIAPDIFILGEGGFGFNPYWGASLAIIGTLAGGIAGYWLGRYLGLAFVVKVLKIKEKYIAKGEKLFNKYGNWAILAACFSPIPLRDVCWLAGICRMRFIPFAAALSLGLIPRYYGLALLGKSFGDIIRGKFLHL